MTAKLIRNAYEAGLTMTAVLLSWGAALVLEGAAGLHTDVLVLAVALTLTLASTQRTAGTRRRLISLVLLPATAAASIFVGRLLAAHYAAGAAVYTAGMALAIWIPARSSPSRWSPCSWSPVPHCRARRRADW
ncbi:MAG: hypothetical protein JF597_02815 [Streptomyces sp.]|uniref:hypothetical protein n=1 Tax=Streptomyces sp. TaxID=1931 RepID=UPI0025FA85EC|nr:hypothetical protein [Streptomyces sp.]MBW8792547.1 hypothetical protein [Streptomyces sp.]